MDVGYILGKVFDGEVEWNVHQVKRRKRRQAVGYVDNYVIILAESKEGVREPEVLPVGAQVTLLRGHQLVDLAQSNGYPPSLFRTNIKGGCSYEINTLEFIKWVTNLSDCYTMIVYEGAEQTKASLEKYGWMAEPMEDKEADEFMSGILEILRETSMSDLFLRGLFNSQ